MNKWNMNDNSWNQYRSYEGDKVLALKTMQEPLMDPMSDHREETSTRTASEISIKMDPKTMASILMVLRATSTLIILMPLTGPTGPTMDKETSTMDLGASTRMVSETNPKTMASILMVLRVTSTLTILLPLTGPTGLTVDLGASTRMVSETNPKTMASNPIDKEASVQMAPRRTSILPLEYLNPTLLHSETQTETLYLKTTLDLYKLRVQCTLRGFSCSILLLL